MSTVANQSIVQVLESWQTADRRSETMVDDLKTWMREVEQLGIPRFGETATRLRPIRVLLEKHIDEVLAMLGEMAKRYSQSQPNIAAIQRQSMQDHSHLISELDNFTGRLKQFEPPFVSWQAAMEEVDSFFFNFEQYEYQESENLRAILLGQFSGKQLE